MIRSCSHIVIASILLLTLVAFQPAPRQAEASGGFADRSNGDEVTAIVAGLEDFAARLGQLAAFEELGLLIPFTDVNPSEVLNLDTLFTDALGALGAPSSLSDLAAIIDALDNPDLNGTGIAVQFNNVVGDDTANTLSFDFVATHEVDVPLKLAHGDVALDGSPIALTFQLSTHFAFGYDDAPANPAEKVFLTDPPTLSVTAAADIPAITAFDSLLGFTSVNVSGSLLLNVAIDAVFADPDLDGRLTEDEWSSTALSDLVSIAFADGAGDDINGNLAFDASMIPGSPDGTVTWVDTDLADGLNTPTVTLGFLDDFTNINPHVVFGGLTSATSALLSAQESGDLPLPMLKNRLSEVFKFADPLVQFIHELGDAAIVYGPNNTVPPSGPVFGLDEGDTVYCQAYTINPVDYVDWRINGVSMDSNLATIGPNPTATAALVLGTGGMDSVTLHFRFQGDPTDRISRPLFLTADQLAAKLGSVAGIDTVTAAYNPDQRILTYHLQHALPPTSRVIETDFGDQLRTQTGLFGLGQTGSDQITVEASGAALDVTFGVILVEDPAMIKPGGTDADRFFLQVNPTGNEFQADVSIAAGSDFCLEGRLAFLSVTACGVTTAGNPGGAIFALTDSDDAPGAPSLAFNINAPGISSPTLPNPIPDAILLTDLISEGLGGWISAQGELGLSCGLEVSASVGSDFLASGKVAVSWPDVLVDGTCTPDLASIVITPDAQFSTDLLSFDIDPNNPQEMLSIILDAIYGFTQGIDGLPAVGDLDVGIPIVGVSPRELLDKLEEINDAINEMRMDPAATLEELADRLEGELELDPNDLTFEVTDLIPGGEKELILRLHYLKNDTIDKPLNFDLDDGGLGLVSASSDGVIHFGYEAEAQFDVAIPLGLSSSPSDVRILDTARASVGGTLDLDASTPFSVAIGPLDVSVSGVAKLDVDVEVDNPSTSPLPLGDWLLGVGVDLTGELQDCGTDGTNALTGQACARFDLDVEGPIGTLGFRAEDITAPDSLATYPGWFVSLPPDLLDEIIDNVLNFGFLFNALPELATKLHGLLEEGAQDVKVPGLGDGLDAGAQIVERINEQVITPLSDIGGQVTGATAGEIEDQIRTEILTLGILLDRSGDGVVDPNDVDVVVSCGGSECDPNTPAALIDDVQVTFLIGEQQISSPSFDIGIDGLPIAASGALSAEVGWQLLINAGISKAEGPYIDADSGGDPEFMLDAFVVLDDNPDPNSCATPPSDPLFFPGQDSFFGGFSDTRCLEGKLAFLSVGFYDGDTPDGDYDTDDPTIIGLQTTLDLESSAPSGRLTVGNIINSVGLEPRIIADADINLALRTSIDVVDGLPGVVGAFHLSWDFDTNNGSLGAPAVAFDHLWLDAGAFATGILDPVTKQVRNVTSPLEPIVDFIRAEVPVLTELREMVGGNPVTLLTLIDAAGGDVDLINSVLQLIDLANNLPGDAPGFFIPLGDGISVPGSFKLLGDRLLQGPTTPDQAPELIDPNDLFAGSGLADYLPGNNGAPIGSSRSGTFGVEGLTFPFLEDATRIFGMLLGQDVTIVGMDFGTFRGTVSKGYEFGPIWLGPFPVTAEVGLAFTGEARFAMGYDTRGLRLVLAGGSATKLFDGIFIDDLDVNGMDVDEWKLTFRVSAEAALDVLIAEAGVYGGVDSTLSGDLNDPTPDGKLYIEEIVDLLSNPICLFIVSGKLDLFLGLYAEVDLLFWSDRWEWEIIRETLLDFTLGCEGTDPVLAEPIGGDLWLNIGDRADLRGIQPDAIDEAFTVRQIGPGKVSVEAFGIKQEYSGVTRIRANAADGDDVIALVRGGDGANPILFTIESLMDGGPGNDSLTGGDGADHLYGGSGADRLSGGKGVDELYGEGDDDRLDGGIGDDTPLDGGSGNDIVMGGPGSDTIVGGEGDDSLRGGPWTEANPDGVDTITGGSGNDRIDGGPGDDFLYGDEDALDCADEGAAGGGADSILGGTGNDTIMGGNGDDRLVGNEGNDKLCGNGGNDILDGDDDNPSTEDAGDRDESGSGGFVGGLFGGPGNDAMYGRGGDDEMFGGDGVDNMFGGAGNDLMEGEAGADDMHGDAGSDVMNGNTGMDTMQGGDDADTMSGNEDDDTMFGDAGADLMYGDAGSDVMRGGADEDTMQGNAGNDEMYGDSGNDLMSGNEDNDTMRGNTGDDHMEGNAGADTMYGDAGQDDMTGGSSTAGEPDGGDLMFGNAAQDVMVGDNGSIDHPGGVDEADGTIIRVVTLLDLASGNPALSGADTMHGNAGNDDMYGGDDGDTMHGDQGDDYLEGNPGGDTMFGDLGQDDLIGGTSTGNTEDAGDTMYGGDNVADLGDDFDVMTGDNATITRPVDANGHWIPNTFNDSIMREIHLFDVATVDNSVAESCSGADTMYGEANYDVLFGQGDDDHMHGGSGDDYMEGNASDDTMNGNAGNDDMVGGTGPINDDPPTGTDGRLDGSDTMHGNDGFDVMAGDNAVLVRTLVDGQWQTNTFNNGIQHEPRILLDIDSPHSPIVSDGDVMFGEGDDDLMYGQGGDDEMHGGDGYDFMEGNADSDTMTGDADQDDMIGGTVQPEVTDADDSMSGNGEDDVMIGDNGSITRPLDPNGHWQIDQNTIGVIRDVVIFDVETVDTSVDPNFSGGDTMNGDDGDDRMFGQGGVDQMHGGDGFDYMEGNHGDDLMFGENGEDDMIGGGSANDGVILPDSVGDGLLDGEDTMYGGEEGDVMSGDNARITRPVDDEGIWLVDPNPVDVVRQIVLFDVETVAGPLIDASVKGSDTMFGDAGRDLMFGQGNTQTDEDGDGRFNEDPPDGRDNDRDGREGTDSLVYDCQDGADNDGDGLIDADDPSCFDAIDEDAGGDEMHGGDGVDYMEGSHGSDWMFGDDDEDDMIGANSAGDGVIGGGVPPTDLLDGDDVMSGGGEDDVLLGDNGLIERPVDESGLWLRHSAYTFDLAVRETTMAQSPEAGGAFGHDFMQGNAGHDDMYGQQGHDYMEGNDGEDAMVGDLGKVTNNVEDGSREAVIGTPPPFFEDVIYPEGSLHRLAELYSFEVGDGAEGHDVMLGGDGRDSLHGGPGNDLMNGDGDSISGEDPVPETDDEDHLFGGDADDVMWGGRGHDHVWGGHGNDHLDVRPRTASEVTAPDTPEWFTYGEPDNFQGLDIVHGGWDQDALQANFAEPGPPVADRLIDWAGGYNVFYVCPGAYGEGTITRMGNPFLRQFLQDLAGSDGALLPATPGACGFHEVGYVFPNDRQHNSHPPHPDHPGHFVCDDGEVEILVACIEIAGCFFCSSAGAHDDADAVDVPDYICEGDLNGDGSVGLPDLGILLANYNEPGAWNYEDGDLDEDGDIDSGDLAEFMLYYGTICEQ